MNNIVFYFMFTIFFFFSDVKGDKHHQSLLLSGAVTKVGHYSKYTNLVQCNLMQFLHDISQGIQFYHWECKILAQYMVLLDNDLGTSVVDLGLQGFWQIFLFLFNLILLS